MASANVSPSKDIDQEFLQCNICLDRLNDPKIVACLNHYCRDCLNTVLKKELPEPTDENERMGKGIECPVCREKHHIPHDGVNEQKTDLNTKSIIEFIKLHDSVKHEPLRVCLHCNQKHKTTGYCFKCNDFLCEECHEFRLTNPIDRDHQPYVFSLNEAEAKALTLEKLASREVAPWCTMQPTKLCCSTCKNLSICMPCTYDAHKGHDLQEASVLAGDEQKKLTTNVEELSKDIQKVYDTRELLFFCSAQIYTQLFLTLYIGVYAILSVRL